MHDLDENLDRAIGARFGALHGSVIAAVSLPGAEEIIARGRRRRRNGHAAVGGLAVLAVLAVGSVLFGPLRVSGAPMPVDDPTMSWYEPPAGAVRPQPGSTIPVGFLPVAQVTEARLEPMCAGQASLVSNGAIAASAAGDGVALLVYGHSSTTIRALAEYRVETTRCVAPRAITDLEIGAGGFLVVRAAGDYQAVVRFGRALLLVRAATDLAVRRAGDLERTLCVFANDCPPREGRPSALSTLEVGGEAFAAVLAVDAQPDAPVLGRAVASASVMGYRTSAASVDCDEGARQRLGLPAGVSHRYVAIYFGALEDAESFASSSTMSVRVVPVRTYCIG